MLLRMQLKSLNDCIGPGVFPLHVIEGLVHLGVALFLRKGAKTRWTGAKAAPGLPVAAPASGGECSVQNREVPAGLQLLQAPGQ